MGLFGAIFGKYYNYQLRDRNGKIVYDGISNNPERRVKEHKRSGKRFSSYTVDSFNRFEDEAREKEKKSIKKHKGKYNKIKYKNS